MPTPETRLPFGKHKGKRLKTLPMGYVQWMANNLRDSDMHEWAQAAQAFLDSTGKREQRKMDLNAEADRILREHGFDPKHVKPD